MSFLADRRYDAAAYRYGPEEYADLTREFRREIHPHIQLILDNLPQGNFLYHNQEACFSEGNEVWRPEDYPLERFLNKLLEAYHPHFPAAFGYAYDYAHNEDRPDSGAGYQPCDEMLFERGIDFVHLVQENLIPQLKSRMDEILNLDASKFSTEDRKFLYAYKAFNEVWPELSGGLDKKFSLRSMDAAADKAIRGLELRSRTSSAENAPRNVFAPNFLPA